MNKLDKQAFQQYCSRNFLRWCRLVTQRETQGVEVMDMAAFAAGGEGTGGELPAIEGAVPFLDD